MKEPKLYKITRPLITILFKLMYRPTIINNSIPNGKVILAGNHTNVLDCLLLISSTKRTIHFLAKKELTKKPFGFIFKAMGIIPVDRSIKDSGAFNEAINVLNNDKLIGIFPEGTITKGDNITLPFKTGAVRMASQTNSQIVPFAITGKYKIFRKNITITFGKAYSVTDNKDKETEILREKINKMIIEKRL